MRKIVSFAATSTLLVAVGANTGCAGDAADAFNPEGGLTAGDGDGDDDDGQNGEDTLPGDTGGTGTDGGDEGDGDGDGDGDGEGEDFCELNCGTGDCAMVGEVAYCDCPIGTVWGPESCGACPAADGAVADLPVTVHAVTGQFWLAGEVPPASEYDDAVVWLENARSGDRLRLGNTHDGSFSVRATPGLYDVVYEVESRGGLMPENGRAILGKVAIFEDLEYDVEIPRAQVTGGFSVAGAAPPASEYDDGLVFFRDTETGDEFLAGNTHDGGYALSMLPGAYELVYRAETPGQIVPHNDGANLGMADVFGTEGVEDIEIPAVDIIGEFQFDGQIAPANEYEDARIELSSENGGTVLLGNTHDQSFALKVVPDVYDVLYEHESGTSVPQNARAYVTELDASEGAESDINVPVIQIAGVLTLNGGAPPADEFDDAVLYFRNAATDDEVELGNTHDGAYSVKIIGGTYDVYYRQETSGGSVPENKGARLLENVPADAPKSVDLDVEAVAISGAFTIGGQTPPSSQYEDGRIFLRNSATGDSVLLGSTHEGGYATMVVPGDYEAFYAEETGGSAVPGNQDASLGPVVIGGAMSLDLDVPAVQLSGKVMLGGEMAPNTPSDGGQLYLRNASGDAVYLGRSYDADYAAMAVAGTYGIFYRAEGSLSMPQNDNGNLGCLVLE